MLNVIDFFKVNPLQKALSLVFALIIWALAPSLKKNELVEVQIFVPVSYVNIPKDLDMTSQPVQTVSVAFDAIQGKVPNPSLFQAVIDLEDAVAGKFDYVITRRSIKHPSDVRITRITPDKLKLRFEKTMEKTLSINPVFVGTPAKGYVIEKVTMVPDKITVKGPVSVLDTIEQLETKAIEVEGAYNDIAMIASVVFPDGVDSIDPTQKIFKSFIEIGSEPINVRFDKIPIGLVNQTYVTRINPKHFNVLLRGPRSLMEGLTKQDIQAFINLKDYKPGTYKVKTPTLRLRPEIQIQEVWPPIDIWVLNQKVYE